MVVASESAPRERESKSSSCRMFFFLPLSQFWRVWEPCCSRWVPRSSWVAYGKCYECYTTHVSSPPLLGIRRRRTRRSIAGRSTNMKAIPWFAQHTSVVDRWSVKCGDRSGRMGQCAMNWMSCGLCSVLMSPTSPRCLSGPSSASRRPFDRSSAMF